MIFHSMKKAGAFLRAIALREKSKNNRIEVFVLFLRCALDLKKLKNRYRIARNRVLITMECNIK